MKLNLITVSLLGLGLAVLPAFADQPRETSQQPPAANVPALPGTVNYVEGTASIDGQTISQNQVGSLTLAAGQELSTGSGKAEVLLTPGVFLRVDSNSTVRMVSPTLTKTQVQIEKGRAGVEVDEIYKENNLQIADAGVTTRLEKTGYYEFNASRPDVMVFKGKADVELANGKGKEVKGNHELVLAANGEPSAKTQGIDENRSRDDLYNWSRLRSQYVAEANNEIAGDYAGAGYYPGWYWDPYMFGYTFIGGGPFYSPFGWGFYPLGWGWGGYGWGGYYGGGYYGHRYYGRGYGHGYQRFGTVHDASRSMAAPHVSGFSGGFHGGSMGGGFHSGGGRR
jgi:hypothetical protein